jgi:DNA-binding CsgD family transcriptional regulator
VGSDPQPFTDVGEMHTVYAQPKHYTPDGEKVRPRMGTEIPCIPTIPVQPSAIHDVISDTTQLLFRRLSIFPAAFDSEVTTIILTDRNMSQDRVFDILAELERAGHLRPTGGVSEKRHFHLTQAAAARAGQQLADSGETASTREALIAWLWTRAKRMIDVYLLTEQECQWFRDRVEYLSLAVEWTWQARTDDRHDVLATVLALLGGHDEARVLLDRALTRTLFSPYRSDLITWSIWLHEQGRRPAEVRALAHRAVELARSGGSRCALARALNLLAAVHGLRENYAKGLACLDEAALLAREFDSFSRSICCRNRAWFLLGAGDTDAAAAALAEVAPDFEATATRHQAGSFLFVAGAIDLASGDLHSARTRFEESLRAIGAAETTGGYPLEGLAMVALGRNQPRRCLMLVTATDRLHRAGGPSIGRTGWWYRNVIAAREQAGTMLPRDEANRLRRAATQLSPRQLSSYALDRNAGLADTTISQLTPREHEITRWVAAGLANREIAQYLDLAENTVSSYLKRIYAKLGIRSRTQLAAWMADMYPDVIPPANDLDQLRPPATEDMSLLELW